MTSHDILFVGYTCFPVRRSRDGVKFLASLLGIWMKQSISISVLSSLFQHTEAGSSKGGGTLK